MTLVTLLAVVLNVAVTAALPPSLKMNSDIAVRRRAQRDQIADASTVDGNRRLCRSRYADRADRAGDRGRAAAPMMSAAIAVPPVIELKFTVPVVACCACAIKRSTASGVVVVSVWWKVVVFPHHARQRAPAVEWAW